MTRETEELNAELTTAQFERRSPMARLIARLAYAFRKWL